MDKKLMDIGRRLMTAESSMEIPAQIRDIIQEAAPKNILFPFAHMGKTLGLTEYEEMAICLLWYCKKEYGKGLEYETMATLLKPYEDKSGQEVFAPCFHYDGQEVFLSPVAYHFLEGRFPKEQKGIQFTMPETGIVYDGKRLLGPGKRLIEEVEGDDSIGPVALVLSGESGSGREYLAGQIAAEHRVSLLMAADPERECSNRDINEVVMGAGLYGSLVCVDVREGVCPRLIKELSWYLPMLIILKNEGQEIKEDIGYTLVTQRLEKPDLETKLSILKGFLEEGEIPEGMKLETMASRRLPMGEFIRYGKSIQAELKANVFEPEKTLYRSGSAYLELLPSTRGFGELKLPEEQERQLRKICDMLASKESVMKKWGFEKKFSYGNGMSILFYGAPGTGKTMAAQVMANELEMPLYRVDLSMLTSKYIGETQKNIGKIFNEADQADCILLFDEADAMFARRSDVSDAQDRYSNGETAYLLQRMEQYTGVSILATNLLQNFDEAFRRRITYMVHFPLPDANLREKIWETIIPDEAAVSGDVDYRSLARLFELSGAAIKNAVLQGACLAMADGQAIGMGHLLCGIQNEYGKQGKSLNEAQKELMTASEVI